MNASKKRILTIIAIAILAIFILNLITQEGVKDLPGNFKELAQIRNENNTGPVFRRYAVSVSDTLWREMQQYGNFMPYTKLGVTEVFFFQETGPLPEEIQLGELPFAPKFTQNCLGKYQKNAMGQVQIFRYPFGP